MRAIQVRINDLRDPNRAVVFTFGLHPRRHGCRKDFQRSITSVIVCRTQSTACKPFEVCCQNGSVTPALRLDARSLIRTTTPQ